MNDVKFHKLIILVNGFVPLALLFWDGYNSKLGANPVEFFLRTTGVMTLSFLLISLSVSPLRKLTGWNQIIRYRRMLGLYAFFYGVVHLVTYSIFDKGLELGAIVSDVWKRPFIALGMTALALLAPLAVTSTNKMVRRLGGKRWQRLHRIVYLAAILGVIHFYLIQKSDFTYPIIYAFVLALLLGYRVYSKLGAGQRRAAAT